MNKVVFLLLILINSAAFTQIISNNEKSDEVKKETEIEPKKKPSDKNGVEIYVGFNPAYTYRTLSENEGFFGEPLGERENEIGEWISSYEVGIRNELGGNFQLQLGVGFAQNRESYSFDSNAQDSVFRYVNTYRHISFPIRVNYVYGDAIALYGAIGVMPKAFLSLQNIETTLDINNQENDLTTIDKDGFNFIVLDVMATLGTKIEFNENYGIFAAVEARQQLTNTYANQSPYIRRPYALGFSFGIQVYL
jgi:hypothetical protein